MYATSSVSAITPPGCIPACICAGCTAIRPTLDCPITRRHDTVTPLPVDFGKIGHDTWPPRWWNGRLQRHEVKAGWAGYLESGLLTLRASTTNGVDGADDKLPGIHSLGLLGLERVSACQPDPPARAIQGLAITTLSVRPNAPDSDMRGAACHQLPSQSASTIDVPEQDSYRDAQSESRWDNCKKRREREQRRGKSTLPEESSHGDAPSRRDHRKRRRESKQSGGSGSPPRPIVGSRRDAQGQLRHKKSERNESGGCSFQPVQHVHFDNNGKMTLWKMYNPSSELAPSR